MNCDKVIKPAPDASGKTYSCCFDTVFNNKDMKFRRSFFPLHTPLGLYANISL